jgi:hypothetical protein
MPDSGQALGEEVTVSKIEGHGIPIIRDFKKDDLRT